MQFSDVSSQWPWAAVANICLEMASSTTQRLHRAPLWSPRKNCITRKSNGLQSLLESILPWTKMECHPKLNFWLKIYYKPYSHIPTKFPKLSDPTGKYYVCVAFTNSVPLTTVWWTKALQFILSMSHVPTVALNPHMRKSLSLKNNIHLWPVLKYWGLQRTKRTWRLFYSKMCHM